MGAQGFKNRTLGCRLCAPATRIAQSLQRFFDALHFANALTDRYDFLIHKPLYVFARFFVFRHLKGEQLVDFIEREPNAFGAKDKANALHIGLRIKSVTRLAAQMRPQQAVFFVKPQRVLCHFGQLCQLANF